MTILTLRIENHTTLENGGRVSLTLDGKSAQVGRKPGNDWVLPDTSRHISGHHFDIQFQGGRYLLVDVSSNGTFLHGERYRLDGAHEIKDGDRFTIGHYIIGAELTAAAPQQTPNSQPVPADGIQDIDEFDDVWGDFDSPSTPSSAPGARDRSSLQAPPAMPSPQMSPVQAPTHAARVPSTGGTQQPNFSQMGQHSGTGVTPAPHEMLKGASASGLTQPPALGLTPQPTLQPPANQPAQAMAPPAHLAPPTGQYDPRAAPPPARSSESFGGIVSAAGNDPASASRGYALDSATADEMIQGFLEAAGVSDSRQLRLPPRELGRILGNIARTGTDELMRMLQDRAAVKLFVSNEDRTMRVATGNNPMKFMLDQSQAFEAMFLNPREGYQTGDAGFENALSDIRRHQSAVIAALQPALAEVLEGLSPGEIEDTAGGRMMGGGGRKSWEEFVKRWESRAAEGENGMLDAFIKAFSRLYAEALRKQ